jgi:hypothetical protein
MQLSTRKDLFAEPGAAAYVHKDAYQLIDSVFADVPSSAARAYYAVRGGIKRLVMYNPLIHGWNIESNVLMALGKDYFSENRNLVSRVRGKSFTPAELDTITYDFAKHGGEVTDLYNISKRLQTDVLEYVTRREITAKDIKNDPMLVLRNPLKTARDLGDAILWDKWVKTGQLVVYKTLRDRFIGEGMKFDAAGKAAAAQANDLMGTLPRNWYTKNQRKGLNALLFARSWSISNLRTLTGTLGTHGASSKFLPKPLRFEGMTQQQLRVMAKQYRRVLYRGVGGVLAVSNAIQAALLAANGKEFHPTWKNEFGHWLDIDTGKIDDRGAPIYLRGWLFRQMNDYYKMVQSLVPQQLTEPLGGTETVTEKMVELINSKMEPLLKTVMSVIANSDYRGEKIYGVAGESDVANLSKYVAGNLTPLKVLTGNEGQTKRWWEVMVNLTGSWVSHGMPAGGLPGVGDMVRRYYHYMDVEKTFDKKTKQDLNDLMNTGQHDKAIDYIVKAMSSGRFSEKQFENQIRGREAPLLSRIALEGGKLKQDFLKFLLGLPKKEALRYIDLIEQETKRMQEVGPSKFLRGLGDAAPSSKVDRLERRQTQQARPVPAPGSTQGRWKVLRQWNPEGAELTPSQSQ